MTDAKIGTRATKNTRLDDSSLGKIHFL